MVNGVLDYRELGRRIHDLRKQRNLTQEELAEAVDISTSFVGHIERGEKQCSLDTVSRLAIYLGTTLDYLALGRNNLCDQQSCPLYVDLKELVNAYGEDKVQLMNIPLQKNTWFHRA